MKTNRTAWVSPAQIADPQKLELNKWLFFKPLCSGMVCCTAIYNWDKSWYVDVRCCLKKPKTLKTECYIFSVLLAAYDKIESMQQGRKRIDAWQTFQSYTAVSRRPCSRGGREGWRRVERRNPWVLNGGNLHLASWLERGWVLHPKTEQSYVPRHTRFYKPSHKWLNPMPQM